MTITRYATYKTIIKKAYFIVLIILAVSLPFSKFAISMSELLLVLIWILDADFKKKFQLLKEKKSLIIFLSIYIIYLLGLIYTTDFKYGLHDITIKLPLLLLPLIIGTSTPLNKKQFKILIYFFTLSIFAKTIQSVWMYLGFFGQEITDIRQISIKLSHIRFAIFINLSFFLLLFLMISKKYKLKKIEKYIIIIALLWFVFFIFFLQSITGIFIFVSINYLLIFYFTVHHRKKVFYIFSSTLLIIIPTIITIYSVYSVINFHKILDPHFSELEVQTINNNLYTHDTTSLIIENGHYVGLFNCKKEVKKQWNKISTIPYDSLGKKGHIINATIRRYLTSKGYKKDSVGISKLTKKDIINIENGIPNYKFADKFRLNNKIYIIIWEIDVYFKGGNPSGHSVTQRIEYLKTSWHIIKKNIIFGVGTGDVAHSFREQYEKDNSKLKKNFRKRSHNQFVAFAVALGLLGFVLITFAIFFPFFKEKKYKEFIPTVFILITFFSMFNEDILETQISITFFALFYSLFILNSKNQTLKSNDKQSINKS